MGLFNKKEEEPLEVDVNGIKMQCTICKNHMFTQTRVQLNTKMLTMLNLDWLNKSATCFTCTQCGHLMWFDAKFRE